MRQKGSIALFRYWNSLRAGRPAPRRTEIAPKRIKSLLADTFILERDLAEAARFRLAGTRICSIYGRELRGISFLSLWDRKDQPLLTRLIEGIFESKDIVLATFDGISRNGRPNPFEIIILPLEGGSENPRGLGALSPVGKPFWLGADPIVNSVLRTVRLVDPTEETSLLRKRTAMEAPALAPVNLASSEDETSHTGGRRIRHLVILDGGRSE